MQDRLQPIRSVHQHHRTSAMEGGTLGRGSRKRPVDPEETGTLAAASYDVVGPNPKRPRTIDDVMGSLCLRQSDPPGNSFCQKRKIDEGMMVGNGRSYNKVAKSADGLPSTEQQQQQQLEPTGRKGNSPTNVTLFDPTMKNQCTSSAQENCESEKSAPDSNNSNTMNDIDNNEMAIDDSDRESDSSVSESSLKNAMYQLVFGRRNPVSLTGAGGGGAGGKYDAVDSKIEDMIRRSRLEAAIKNQKNANEEESSMEIDTNMERDDNTDVETNDWIPGHG